MGVVGEIVSLSGVAALTLILQNISSICIKLDFIEQKEFRTTVLLSCKSMVSMVVLYKLFIANNSIVYPPDILTLE